MNWKTAVSQIERVYTAKGRAQEDQFSIEGIRLVERALRAGVRPEFVVIAEHVLKSPSYRMMALVELFQNEHIEQVFIPDSEMERLTNGRSLGGIVAALPKPKPVLLNDLLYEIDGSVVVTAVDIIDPGNTGAMIRTAHASGCAAFIAVGRTDPFHPKAVRTSMGSLFKLPMIEYDSIDSTISDLANNGFLTVGTDLAGKRPLPDVNFQSKNTAILMGNEYEGLPHELIEKLDLTLTIPMPTGVDSFSVNAATAVILYEINRQKWNKKG
ncbi:MAG: RNA methyltransferase [Chloroflexota bacterium]